MKKSHIITILALIFAISMPISANAASNFYIHRSSIAVSENVMVIREDGSVWLYFPVTGQIMDELEDMVLYEFGSLDYLDYLLDLLGPIEIGSFSDAIEVTLLNADAHSSDQVFGILRENGYLYIYTHVAADGNHELQRAADNVLAFAANGAIIDMENNLILDGRVLKTDVVDVVSRIDIGWDVPFNTARGMLFALRSDGTLWRNIGGFDPRIILVDIVQIDANNNVIYVLGADGGVWAHQVGLGTPSYTSQVTDDAIHMSAGTFGMIVSKTDGMTHTYMRIIQAASMPDFGDKLIAYYSVGQGRNRLLPGSIYALYLMNDGSVYALRSIIDWDASVFAPRELVLDQVAQGVASPITRVGVYVHAIGQQGNPSAWASEQVNFAISQGLVPEDLQRLYSQSITRAEFAELAVLLYESVAGREIEGRMQRSMPTDINMLKMGYLGVVTNVGDRAFAPGNPVIREEAAVMLSRLADAMGHTLAQMDSTFIDSNQISDWAIEEVGKVQAAGIMNGGGASRFDPQDFFTREQAIVTMVRLFELID